MAEHEISQKDGVAAIVEPIKAGGALAGFAIGFLASYRSSASMTDAALHGLLGALILGMIAWYLGLLVAREVMQNHVEEQKRIYVERVEAMNSRVRSGGTTRPLPVAQMRTSIEAPRKE